MKDSTTNSSNKLKGRKMLKTKLQKKNYKIPRKWKETDSTTNPTTFEPYNQYMQKFGIWEKLIEKKTKD